MLRIRTVLTTLLTVLVFVSPVWAEKRAALVIGNATYVNSPALTNPANDANDIAAALSEMGFEVLVGVDLDKRGFDGKVREFTRMLAQADVALFYYAGHGLQISGRNYLVPVDARLETERDLDFEGIALDFILNRRRQHRYMRPPCWDESRYCRRQAKNHFRRTCPLLR